MPTYIVTLDPTVYKNPASAKSAAGKGGNVEKDYRLPLTFKVKGNKTNINKIPGVLFSEDLDTILSAEHTNIGIHGNSGPSWNIEHLKRTSVNNSLVLGWQPEDTSKGKGSTVYLLDTGLEDSHIELQNANVTNLYNVTSATGFVDTAGHGTAMASLIVGENIGVSPNTNLVNIKLFNNSSGNITVGEIIDALEEVLNHHQTNDPGRVKTVCMPWVVTKNQLIDNTLNSLLAENLILVAAAGNDGNETDVDTHTPGGLDSITTIGSTDEDFYATTFMNLPLVDYVDEETTPSMEKNLVSSGAKIDLFAPGTNVCIADVSNVTNYVQMTGTSPATAITAGAVSHWINLYPTVTANILKSYMLSDGHYSASISKVTAGDPPWPTMLDYSLLTWPAGKVPEFKKINFAILTTPQQTDNKFTEIPSGRLFNIQHGTSATANIGINSVATDVSVLDFSPLSPWMTIELNTGEFLANTVSTPANIAPGVYHFAIKGEINNKIVVEEYSVGVYATNEDELTDSSEFYYDTDTNSYEEVITYSVAPTKDGVRSKKCK